MKKKIKIVSAFILILFLNLSCSLEDSEQQLNFSIDVMPIESVDVDEVFILGRTHQIKLTYFVPSNCHEFNGFIYDIEGNQRTIAIANTVYARDNCVEIDETNEVSLNIEITSSDTYVFRFYQGKDDQDNDVYHLVEVPVVE